VAPIVLSIVSTALNNFFVNQAIKTKAQSIEGQS
jgi:hypothetical protein